MKPFNMYTVHCFDKQNEPREYICSATIYHQDIWNPVEAWNTIAYRLRHQGFKGWLSDYINVRYANMKCQIHKVVGK